MTRLSNVWNGLRSSIWPIPSLMVVAAGIIAFVLIYLDTGAVGDWFRSRLWFWVDGPEGARSVLTVVAGSMITVAGVVYSITIVALVLASSQYGSRLLRNFTRDLGNQITLGTFTATLAA